MFVEGSSRPKHPAVPVDEASVREAMAYIEAGDNLPHWSKVDSKSLLHLVTVLRSSEGDAEKFADAAKSIADGLKAVGKNIKADCRNWKRERAWEKALYEIKAAASAIPSPRKRLVEEVLPGVAEFSSLPLAEQEQQQQQQQHEEPEKKKQKTVIV